jgi:hypothetical protein
MVRPTDRRLQTVARTSHVPARTVMPMRRARRTARALLDPRAPTHVRPAPPRRPMGASPDPTASAPARPGARRAPSMDRTSSPLAWHDRADHQRPSVGRRPRRIPPAPPAETGPLAHQRCRVRPVSLDRGTAHRGCRRAPPSPGRRVGRMAPACPGRAAPRRPPRWRIGMADERWTSDRRRIRRR